MTSRPSSVTRWLSKANPFAFNGYCVAAAFTTYFCMYAFRKPFAAGTFEGQVELPFVGAIDTKILLILSQVLGYTISKFWGIKLVSEASRDHRARTILLLIVFAELSLLVFPLVPRGAGAFLLFCNGLPLGMVWGLLFSFLEGRRTTELLGAGLSTSYIVSSGVVKSTGRWVIDLGLPEEWMPAATGLLYLPLLLIALKALSLIPPPTAEDEALRTERRPMDRASRHAFLRRYWPGLAALTLFYMALTAYRDFRDNFAREIWDSVGYAGDALIFTRSEAPIALGVLVVLALVVLIKDNRRATAVIHGILVGGTLLIGSATALYQLGAIESLTWMIAVGLGLYLGYVPLGCVLFDRIIAETRFVGTAGFMIYVTDAFGYLGSLVLLLYKNFGQPQSSSLEFFIGFSYVTSLGCAAGFFFSLVYFYRKASPRVSPQSAEARPGV
jgi:hypothetical protein